MKTEKSIDAHLVRQLQAGDTQALTALVKRWHKLFCEKAYWIIKDADQSKDIAQESWRIIIAKIQDLKEPEKFKYWALRIVYSKSLDLLKASNKKRMYLENFACEKELDTATNTHESQLKKDLLKALKLLSAKQQEVIKLFYVEDYTLKEIGSLLQISVGTAKSRLFHAREQLKTILKHRTYEN